MKTKTRRNRLFVLFVLLAALTIATGSGVLQAFQFCDGTTPLWRGCYWFDEPYMTCDDWYYACIPICEVWGGINWSTYWCQDEGDTTRGECWCNQQW
jgi:hypothetical protein